MLSERMLTGVIKTMTKHELAMEPTTETHLPGPKPNMKYMLYMHIPFCQRLCPYCSFNRYPFREEIARPYFANLRREMLMLKDLGYDFESIYCGGGTPTIMIDPRLRDARFSSRPVLDQRGQQRDQPQPPHSALSGKTQGTRAAPVRWSPEL